MKSDPWNETEIERLRKIASEGYTSLEAASMMGRTHHGVRSASTRHGVRWKAFKKLPLPDGSPRAIQHYGDDGLAGAFACRIAQTGMRATGKHYGFSYSTTKIMNRRMKEECGMTRAEKQAIFVKALEEGKSVTEAGALVSMGRNAAYGYWRHLKARKFTAPCEKNVPAQMPADFPERADKFTAGNHANHYGVTRKVILRWCKENDLTVQAYVRTKKELAPKPPKPPQITPKTHKSNAMLPAANTPPRDISAAGEAAQFLRRTMSNVYRASVLSPAKLREKGIKDGGVNSFVVGRHGIVPAAEVIEMAKARGFEVGVI